jgi:hypothetical protein
MCLTPRELGAARDASKAARAGSRAGLRALAVIGSRAPRPFLDRGLAGEAANVLGSRMSMPDRLACMAMPQMGQCRIGTGRRVDNMVNRDRVMVLIGRGLPLAIDQDQFRRRNRRRRGPCLI